MYGGATGGGNYAADELFKLSFKNPEEASWSILPVIGNTPGRRYGHVLVVYRQFVIVFGGNTGSEAVNNDLWILDLSKTPLMWNKLEVQGAVPAPRIYHSASLCQAGPTNGMIFVFGGRGADGMPCNDTWGLRRHRNGTWDWLQAPHRSSNKTPVGRYQHSSLCIGTLLVVLGGRTNSFSDSKIPLQVYDAETQDWYTFQGPQRFRHASFLSSNSLVYLFGGCEHEAPDTPSEYLVTLDMIKIVKGHDKLLTKISLPLSLPADGKQQQQQGELRNIPGEATPSSVNNTLIKPQLPLTELESNVRTKIPGTSLFQKENIKVSQL